MLLVLLTLVGCADGVSTVADGDPMIVVFPTETGVAFEEVLVDPGAEREAGAEVAPGDDPCTCTTVECLEAWVDDHLGCDVCAGFVCDAAPADHACSACGGVEVPDTFTGAAGAIR